MNRRAFELHFLRGADCHGSGWRFIVVDSEIEMTGETTGNDRDLYLITDSVTIWGWLEKAYMGLDRRSESDGHSHEDGICRRHVAELQVLRE